MNYILCFEVCRDRNSKSCGLTVKSGVFYPLKEIKHICGVEGKLLPVQANAIVHGLVK